MILASRVMVVLKSGSIVKYTHVTKIESIVINKEPFLLITGETIDVFKMPRISHDKHPIDQLLMTIIEWYIPK